MRPGLALPGGEVVDLDALLGGKDDHLSGGCRAPHAYNNVLISIADLLTTSRFNSINSFLYITILQFANVNCRCREPMTAD